VLLTARPVSHFSALLIFALLVSMAIACIGERTPAERIKYAAWSFFLFIAIGVGIAWLMYPLSR
jgi:hypothetical protein